MPETKKNLDAKAFPDSAVVQVVETAVNDCAIESVVVYQDRAEVKRAIPVKLLPGENEVIVTNLAESVDKNSIRVEGRGKATITDVVYTSKTTTGDEKPPAESKDRFKGEITDANRELKELQFKEEALRKEKDLLVQFANHVSKIHSVKSEETSLSQLVDQGTVAVVMEFFEKYEAKCADLDARLLTVSKNMAAVNDKIAALHINADKFNPNQKKVAQETIRALHVGLEAPEEVDAVLYISYVVTNASWSSAYDVRVFTKDKAMKVQYYGLIKQQTGEDWNDAKVSLSTAQPSVGGAAPVLPTRLIHFKRPKPKAVQSYRAACYSLNYDEHDPTIEDSYRAMDGAIFISAASASGGKKKSRMISKRRRGSSESPPPPALEVAVADVSAGLYNTTYAIPRATTIPADNTEHKVTVALVDLSPEFNYTSVPRLSPHSFLQAKAKNTSPYAMLAGPSNVFLDNNFIAKSQLSDVSPSEEFTTSLGVDQSVRITCQPIATVHNTRSGLLGGVKSNLITYTHAFVVKNTKADTVDIKVMEQVPLSTDERIKVTIQEPDLRKANIQCPLPCGYAILNDSNNVEWYAKVKPNEELELILLYTVEHPAQDAVEGLPK